MCYVYSFRTVYTHVLSTFFPPVPMLSAFIYLSVTVVYIKHSRIQHNSSIALDSMEMLHEKLIASSKSNPFYVFLIHIHELYGRTFAVVYVFRCFELHISPTISLC